MSPPTCARPSRRTDIPAVVSNVKLTPQMAPNDIFREALLSETTKLAPYNSLGLQDCSCQCQWRCCRRSKAKHSPSAAANVLAGGRTWGSMAKPATIPSLSRKSLTEPQKTPQQKKKKSFLPVAYIRQLMHNSSGIFKRFI